MAERQEVVHSDALPHEVSVRVSNELTAKGEMKPSVEIKITQRISDMHDITKVLEDILGLAVQGTKSKLSELLGEETRLKPD